MTMQGNQEVHRDIRLVCLAGSGIRGPTEVRATTGMSMSRGSRWWRWRTSWYYLVAAHARRRSWSSYGDSLDQGKPTSENSSKYVNFGRKVFKVCGVILKAIWLFEIKIYIIFILKYTLIFVSILLPVVVKFDMKKCHNSSFIILGFCSFYLLSWFTSFTFVMVCW